VSEELKECPSCTSDDVELTFFDRPGLNVKDHYVYCGTCGVRGPFGTEAGAIGGWNGLPRKPETGPATKVIATRFKYILDLPSGWDEFIWLCRRGIADMSLTPEQIRDFLVELGWGDAPLTRDQIRDMSRDQKAELLAKLREQGEPT
jgi:hypothetical protein